MCKKYWSIMNFIWWKKRWTMVGGYYSSRIGIRMKRTQKKSYCMKNSLQNCGWVHNLKGPQLVGKLVLNPTSTIEFGLPNFETSPFGICVFLQFTSMLTISCHLPSILSFPFSWLCLFLANQNPGACPGNTTSGIAFLSYGLPSRSSLDLLW